MLSVVAVFLFYFNTFSNAVRDFHFMRKRAVSSNAHGNSCAELKNLILAFWNFLLNVHVLSIDTTA